MKKMKTMKTIRLLLLSLIIIISGCSKDSPNPIITGNYENGYFVTNEGAFMGGVGSISFVDENGIVENDVFARNNSFSLGNTVQSMNIINEKIYIVENGSGSIKVASKDSMIFITSINVGSPRYIEKVSESKAYLTDWETNAIHVINTESDEIITTIPVGSDPEKIAIMNGKAYVCNRGHSQSGPIDNTISVIDINTDQVITTITVNDKPNSIAIDENNNIWVLCEGTVDWSNWPTVSTLTSGSLTMISGVNNTVEKSFNIEPALMPTNLVVNSIGNTLYYATNDGVNAIDIYSTELPQNTIISKAFYALDYNNGYIFGTDVVDYAQQGWSYRFTTSGSVVDSVRVGIIPGGYCFN